MPSVNRLSHAARRRRRRAIAMMYKRGRSTKEIAAKFHVSLSMVSGACREFAVPVKHGRPRGPGVPNEKIAKVTRAQWGKTDWSRRDVDIARDYGVCRERVRQVRKLLSQPRVSKRPPRDGPGRAS